MKIRWKPPFRFASMTPSRMYRSERFFEAVAKLGGPKYGVPNREEKAQESDAASRDSIVLNQAT